MILTPNIGFKSVRGKSKQGKQSLSIFIVNPTEGQQIEGNPIVSFEVEFSSITITQPTEDQEIEGNPTINFEIE